MASYQLRLEHKKKFKEFTQGFALITSMQWEWVKSKFIPEKLFHHVIINDIKKQLESGIKEVRYYIYTGVDMYESLEDSYEFYKKENLSQEHINYSEDWYVLNMLHVKLYFDKFEDIEFIEHDAEMCSYFSIKTKF